MITVEEFERFALELPENQRATLAIHLLHSLSAPLQDHDEGLVEALRRDAEMDSLPSIGMTLAEFETAIQKR